MAVLLALFGRGFVCELRRIDGVSMTPTLWPGDRVLVNRMIYAPGLPPWLSRLLPVRPVVAGDVVLARVPAAGRRSLVKRATAVDGQEPGGTGGTVWLLGDHRADSLDSRAFGAVPATELVGRVTLVVGSRRVGAGPWPWLGWRPARFLRPVR